MTDTFRIFPVDNRPDEEKPYEPRGGNFHLVGLQVGNREETHEFLALLKKKGVTTLDVADDILRQANKLPLHSAGVGEFTFTFPDKSTVRLQAEVPGNIPPGYR